MAPQTAAFQRVPELADENDVMREQLEYLIEHTVSDLKCGCAECQRYLRVRAVLLEIFAEPPRAALAPELAKAA